MAQGKYTRPRRRRRLNPRFVILMLILITLLAVLGTVLLHACEQESPAPTEPPQTQATVPVSKPTTVPTTKPTTAPTEAPTTAPTTAPATEPSTEPTTEATTQPTTEPTTEPTTAPTQAPTEPPIPASSAIGEQVAEVARTQIGKPYAYGGVGPDGFDASGLAVYCYAQNGVQIPRTTEYQAASGTAVPSGSLEPGDIVFFWSENPGVLEYEGIYTGDGKFVAARHGDNPVTEMDLWGDYFSSHFICACRYY